MRSRDMSVSWATPLFWLHMRVRWAVSGPNSITEAALRLCIRDLHTTAAVPFRSGLRRDWQSLISLVLNGVSDGGHLSTDSAFR